jgi:Holliday junction resolvase RusA-like endonuclease
MVQKGKKPRAILYKSAELKSYEKSFIEEIPENCKVDMIGDLNMAVVCYFSSRRPDVDNAAKSILDCLQKGGVIRNDRSVMKLTLIKELDKDNPRVDIAIKRIR